MSTIIPVPLDTLLSPRVDCRHHAEDRGGRLPLGYSVCQHAVITPRAELVVAMAIPMTQDLAADRRTRPGLRRGSMGVISCPACAAARAQESPVVICAHDALELFGVETPLDS